MTTQQPHALYLADELELGTFVPNEAALRQRAAAELRRLHAYCQELESQVILDCMTHVQNPAEIEHVAGDVSKNGAGLNMGTQHARITELESQLAQRFDAADMATAAAQGFRDGAAKEQQAGWVSVDERLPGEQGQDSEEVMLFINGHCKLTDMECRQGGAWGLRLGYFDADRQAFRVHGRPEPHVTHWRQEPPAPPIPAAPNPADGESK